MSSSQTSHNPDNGPLLYDAVGYASIELTCSKDGVTLMANSDGLRSLAVLFEEMARRTMSSDHIHLTPSLQLTSASEGFVVGRRDDGPLPDGSSQPPDESS